MDRGDFFYRRFKDHFPYAITSDQDRLFRDLATFMADDDHDILVVNGYAGTGKTTAIAAVIDALDDLRPVRDGIPEEICILLAPTGRAAKVNIAEVYKTAEELMGQLNAWMSSYVKIGESLEKAKAAYGDATRKLSESNQSVIRKIQKLEKLGLSPKKSQGKIRTTGRTVGPGSIVPQELSNEEETPQDE